MKWRSLDESTPGTDTRSLREQFAERKELIAKYVPAATQAVHARVVSDLKQSGIEQRALRVGQHALEFALRITTASWSAPPTCYLRDAWSSASSVDAGAPSVLVNWK
jgi:hypothetical protein